MAVMRTQRARLIDAGLVSARAGGRRPDRVADHGARRGLRVQSHGRRSLPERLGVLRSSRPGEWCRRDARELPIGASVLVL